MEYWPNAENNYFFPGILGSIRPFQIEMRAEKWIIIQ